MTERSIILKKIAILGSTGSIGTQALDILSHYEGYDFVALSTNENIDLLEKQVKLYQPSKVGVINLKKAAELSKRLPQNIKVLSGEEALVELASLPEVDIVLVAVVGISGLKATLAALESGKDIALANKETLVAGGRLVMETARKSGAEILPVDSEHSAIFQCLQGSKGKKEVDKIYLTASGGPFRGYKLDMLKNVKVADALRHPRWNMGKKVTIDSATMMNKGLEVIEAKWLFELSLDKIKVLVHPQSIIHSMVEFIDGSILAQIAETDMRLPILYAFTWPRSVCADIKRMNFQSIGTLTFEEPDFELFPSLKLAYEAMQVGGTMPVVLNAANEVAVELFLASTINFTDIPRVVEHAMEQHKPITNPTLDDILMVDQDTRNRVKRSGI